MGNRNGTVRQRILGRRLRRLREEAGHTLEAAAAALEISGSRLARIETAQQGVEIHLVKSMLDLYDIGGDRWKQTLDLVRVAATKPWWSRNPMGENYTFVQYESDASEVKEYTTGFVPGLLQVPAYAQALFATSFVARTPERLEMVLKVRMFRQQRLTDENDPLQLHTVIEEAILRNPVGGREVLSKQLTRLIEAAELPTVTLQILPARPGAHASLGSGFSILSFGDLGEPDMAHVEHALGQTFVEDEQEVLLAQKKFDQLRTLALSPADSLRLLREIAADT